MGDDAPTGTRLALAERYLTVAEVAQLVKMTTGTVYKLIDSGELSVVSLGPRGGAKRIPESSVADFLTRRGVAFTYATQDTERPTSPSGHPA